MYHALCGFDTYKCAILRNLPIVILSAMKVLDNGTTDPSLSLRMTLDDISNRQSRFFRIVPI